MTVDRYQDEPERCPDDTHEWVDEEYDEDELSVIYTRRCGACDLEETLQLNSDDSEFVSDFREWTAKEEQDEDIHWVTFEAVETDGPFAIVKIAVYYEGQHDPEYHGEYVFEA